MIPIARPDIGEEEVAAVTEVLRSGMIAQGRRVAELEERWADRVGTRHAIAVGNGTVALAAILAGLELGPGDEVITVGHTFAATANAILSTGATPVFVDIEPDTYLIDAKRIERAITSRTRALLPVHLFGLVADMDMVRAIGDRYGLAVVEDAAQAHGATRDGLRAGGRGLAGCFSFYPGKNLGALGDAGALVTDDEGLAERARALREHGQRAKYHHDLEGFTARLDTIQALALLHKLPLLDAWNEQRRAVARFYTHALDGVGDLQLPPVPAGSEPVWHLYVVRTADPVGLASFLSERGIGSGRHYPQPVHLSPAYASLSYGRGSFPVTEQLADRVLSLPIFPGLAEAQLDAVVGAVRDFFERG